MLGHPQLAQARRLIDLLFVSSLSLPLAELGESELDLDSCSLWEGDFTLKLWHSRFSASTLRLACLGAIMMGPGPWPAAGPSPATRQKMKAT